MNNMNNQQSNVYSLLNTNDFNDPNNIDKLYMGDNISYTTPSKSPISKKYYKGDTVINKNKPPNLRTTPTPISIKNINNFNDIEYELEIQQDETYVVNIFNYIINFFKKIDSFFTNINYSNTYVQISIIISIMYIISTLISTLHINISI